MPIKSRYLKVRAFLKPYIIFLLLVGPLPWVPIGIVLISDSLVSRLAEMKGKTILNIDGISNNYLPYQPPSSATSKATFRNTEANMKLCAWLKDKLDALEDVSGSSELRNGLRKYLHRAQGLQLNDEEVNSAIKKLGLPTDSVKLSNYDTDERSPDKAVETDLNKENRPTEELENPLAQENQSKGNTPDEPVKRLSDLRNRFLVEISHRLLVPNFSRLRYSNTRPSNTAHPAEYVDVATDSSICSPTFLFPESLCRKLRLLRALSV